MNTRPWQTASEIANLLDLLGSASIPAPEARESVRSIMDQYPFFVLPLELLLRNYPESFDDKSRLEAMKKIASKSSDPEAFFKMESPDSSMFDHFYPDPEKKTMSTGDAITTFLETYGEEDPGESAMLERLIFNPVGDWSTRLEMEELDADKTIKEEEFQPDDTLRRIDSFISAHRQETSQPVQSRTDKKSQPKPAADSLLSQSLAKIYIKQHRYDKAYEIISQLSLNYPEKSCYFADQLRFLRKLMITQQ